MKTANATVVVNGVAITPAITEILSEWMGTFDHPHSETTPESNVDTLVKIQDILIDKMEESYPNIDSDIFEILSTIKRMRIDFERLIPEREIED